MATYYKRNGKRGIRWTARVRAEGREAAKTFATKGAAEHWAKMQERAIESGERQKPADGVIFADLVVRLIEHHKTCVSKTVPRTRTRTGGNCHATNSIGARKAPYRWGVLYTAETRLCRV